MDLGISGRIAFVSGGSKGVGRQVSEMLAREGCRIIVVARGREAIDDTVASIARMGGMAIGVSADLTRKEDILAALEAGRSAFGAMPDIAITNVHGPGPGDLMDVDPEDFVRSFRDLTVSAVHLAQAVLPHMKEKRWGRVVGINSGAAKEPPPDLKHLLANSVRASGVSLNKSLANEFGSYGITVNTIGTGYIASERMYAYLEKVAKERGVSKEAMIEETSRQIPMRRPGTPAEEAALIVFLCSELAGYITGNYITVDGGHHRSAW
jgi:3-oxoacyl-[acyl-carrier protein] reductase